MNEKTLIQDSNDAEKPKKVKLKRVTSSLDSCVRTDLLALAPNAGKVQALNKLFESYRAAFVEMTDLIWTAFKSSDSVVAWKQVSEANALHKRSVILQPAEAQAKGGISSYLGWLEKDVAKLICKLDRRLRKKSKTCSKEEATRVDQLAHFVHELRAINKRHAWCWKNVDQGTPIMRSEKSRSLSPASARSFNVARRMFIVAAKNRSIPNASRCHVELTRGGAKLMSDQIEMTGEVLKELGITVELSKGKSSFPYWLRVAVCDSSLDPLAKVKTSILVPAKGHRAFFCEILDCLARAPAKLGMKGFPFILCHGGITWQKEQRG